MLEKLKNENAELKWLLLLAIDDLHRIQDCSTCEHTNNRDDPHCKKGCFYEWKYESEAEKLLCGW